MTTEEKEAAKAAKLAEKEAAKAAPDSSDDEDEPEEQNSAIEDTPNAYKSIESDGVFPVRPLTAKAFNMASVIAKQPRVLSLVPLKDDETIGGAFHIWQENGFKIHVLKGVQVSLPSQVAKAISDEYTNVARATREVKVRNPITGELVDMNITQKSENERARLGA